MAKITFNDLRERKTELRWVLLTIFVVVMALILPKQSKHRLNYQQGSTWLESDLISQLDFAIEKTPEELEADRQEVLAQCWPVLEKKIEIEEENLSAFRRRLAEWEQDILLAFSDSVQRDSALRRQAADRFTARWGIPVREEFRSAENRTQWKSHASQLAQILGSRGYCDLNLGVLTGSPLNSELYYVRISATERELRQRESMVFKGQDLQAILPASELPGDADGALWKLFSASLFKDWNPSLIYNDVLTRSTKEEMLDQVLNVKEKISRGSIVVKRGDLIDGETAQVLDSYQSALMERGGRQGFWGMFLAQFLIMAVLTTLMGFFLQRDWPRIFYRNRKLALVLLIFFVNMVLVGLTLKLSIVMRQDFRFNFAYLAPLCMVPITLTAFFDSRLGFFGNLMMTLMVSVFLPNGMEFFFIQFCAGAIAVYSLDKLRNRAGFFLSLFYVLLSYAVTFSAYNLYVKGGPSEVEWANLMMLVLNVVLTIITFPLIYLFEKIFGLTSDITFVELLDSNHPLLKDMQIKAPGTFQHSLQVANLAEAILNRIGGNALMARVGALYHDVGKLKNPRYFTENMSEDHNPHEKLSYKESAEIIIRHVEDGVKLAQEHGIPREVIDFIRTHHGTSRTEFFYRKHLLEHPGDEHAERYFTYPGPLPYTREMAVVMIADGVEASCRSMKKHTPEGIREMVDNIISSRVKQHQFESSDITYKDIEDIRQVAWQQLLSMYHSRIEYPQENAAETSEIAGQS